MLHPFQRLLGAFASLCLATSLTASLSGCGGGGGTADTPTPPPVVATGQIAGQVLGATDATPVAGARVTAAGTSTTSDAQGRFTLAAVPLASAVVLRIQADGHLDAVLPLLVLANQTTTVTQRLTAAAGAQTFSAAAPGTVRAANSLASVDLPADGFVVDGGTTAATGTLSARLTVIDPVRDPAAMPGRYVSTTGRAIESFGALSVDLRDAAGNKLNLKAGATATVRIPLATRSANAPATVPLFHLNETTGEWVQEGQATLKTTAQGSYYEGSVSHFSVWNADREMDTIYVNGCVNDATGKPVGMALVTATGVDYSGSAYDLSASTGKFRVAIRKGSLAEVVATSANLSSTPLIVGPSDTDITLPSCLVLDAPAVPTIAIAPADRTAVEGQQVYFNVSARGGELRYQWQRNGVDLAGETFSTLNLTARLADDGARYTCVVSNSLGRVTSAAGVLHASAATVPVIDEQPVSASALVGGTVTFVASALGSGPLSYQWQRNGVDIAGATAPVYTTPALVLADQGTRYRLVVRNAYGSVTSAEATLSVTAVVLAAPSITVQPTDVSRAAGLTATFTVLATGSPAPTYQWLKNGTAIPGATSTVYITPALTTADNGTSYSVRVTNSEGSVTSASAVLTVPVNTGGSDADKANLMRLLGTAGIWLEAVGAPMEVSDEQGVVIGSAAVCSSGSVSATLNGANVVVGQTLPASGALATRFTDCIDNGTRYNGSASANYTLTSLSSPINGNITVTLANLRMADIGGSTDDTVDGGASVVLGGSLDNGTLTQTVIVTPAAGTRITNNLLGLSAALSGGSLTVGSGIRASDDRLLTSRISYTDFSFTVAGTPYVTSGSLVLGFSTVDGRPTSGNGEIRLFSNGATMGRLYFLDGTLQIEVNGTVQPFSAGGRRSALSTASPLRRAGR